MLAKNNDGQATKNSKRILLMCDIGKRGLNNWPILGVCNFVTDSNITDDIQFDFGRACRWPPSRIPWHRDENLVQFLTTMHFMPPVLYVERRDDLKLALDQITGLRAYVKSKNLPTWESMLNGQAPRTIEAEFNPPAPLSPDEKVALANKLGATLRETDGDLTDDDIKGVVRILGGDDGGEPAPAKLVLGTDYVKNLLKPEGKKYVRHILGLDVREKFDREPIMVVRQLKPKPVDQYTVSELEQFVNEDHNYADEHLNERIQRLRDGDKITRHDVAKELQRIQHLTYHEPPKFWTLWGDENGVIIEVANELKSHLVGIGALDPDYKFTREKVAAACKILFGVGSAGEHHEMDQHAYHIAIRERYRTDIKALARSLLLRDGVLPNLEALARYHGEQPED
jgi:hypothetical protein